MSPPPGARDVWARIDAFGPGVVVVLKPDHVRDVDLFVRWYGAAAYGPQLFWRDDVPRTELQPVQPGDELPGGLQAQHDGRGAMETPVYLPEQRALVFADGMTAPGGVLRAWATPWHEQRTLPALRALLALEFECVLVSHGEPVHERGEFVAALEREPWSAWSGPESIHAGNRSPPYGTISEIVYSGRTGVQHGLGTAGVEAPAQSRRCATLLGEQPLERRERFAVEPCRNVGAHDLERLLRA
jgi:hypothetical protein